MIGIPAGTALVGGVRLVLGGWYRHDHYPDMLVQVVLPHVPSVGAVPMGLLYQRSEAFGDLWAVRNIELDATDARLMRQVYR